jgi:hypothetical protein
LFLLIRPLVATLCFGVVTPVFAQSDLLTSVKDNPGEAKALCRQFRQQNASGQSVLSKQAIANFAAARNLTYKDADVLTTYVVGLHCDEVF